MRVGVRPDARTCRDSGADRFKPWRTRTRHGGPKPGVKSAPDFAPGRLFATLSRNRSLGTYGVLTCVSTLLTGPLLS